MTHCFSNQLLKEGMLKKKNLTWIFIIRLTKIKSQFLESKNQRLITKEMYGI